MALGLGFVAVLAAALGLGGCGNTGPAWSDKRPRVLATIPPLASFARNVLGEHGEVRSLCTTSGPHNTEYKMQDALQLRDADLFLAVGLGLDDKFADPMQAHSRNDHLKYVKLGNRLPADLKIREEDHKDAKGDKHADKDDHGHEHEGEYDPHAWLGIPEAKAMVAGIRDELKKIDPQHAADYDANAKKYTESLDKLRDDGLDKLKDKKNRKIIAFHDSLAYFARSFKITIVASIELVPGAEPSAVRLADLVKMCKEQDVRVIAVEPQYPNSSSAKTLKDELKAKNLKVDLAEVDPLETAADLEDLAGWYEKKTRGNLDNLAKALP
jgi:ABC-type Zn uptake system ZnuABC Zn-binding protein ZnuA